MNWGLIGCGVIGERRTLGLPHGVSLSTVFDIDLSKATSFAKRLAPNAHVAKNPEDFFASKPEAVIIATVNGSLAPMAQACLNRGLPILVEKPAARSFSELKALSNPKKAVIKIGFNHRYHPANLELRKRLAANTDDPVMFIRAQYGNGARVGFDKEWRSDIELAGGGELLDQGVHVIDLASQFIPNLKVVAGVARTHFWNMPVDDNGWGILEGQDHETFSFHVSSSEWKNEFRFEVYTRKTKYQWLGLGRSYGPEKLITHKMKPEMGPPETTEILYPPEDLSWLRENENFLASIKGSATIDGGYEDALHSLKCVDDIYNLSKKNCQTGTHPRWWGMS